MQACPVLDTGSVSSYYGLIHFDIKETKNNMLEIIQVRHFHHCHSDPELVEGEESR